MKKIILITGANGMLSKHLTKQLESEYEVRFLTRKVTNDNEYLWDLKNSYIDANALKNIHTIIHLAGSSIAEKRWTEEVKEHIYSSRIDTANLIFEKLKEHQITIDTFISASAVGYYGTITTNIIFDEKSPKGNDFLSDVCDKWEKAAHKFKSSAIAKRVAIVRIGIILAKNDGALKKIVQPIKYRIGSGIGTGNQYMPWIHIQDLSNMFHFILNSNQLEGTFNAVSPEYVTNIELTKQIGKVINRPILLPNIPKFVISRLFGEMGSLLLNGSRVSSEKIKNAGFNFQFESLNDALNDIL
ncbi:MAG: TIGR01777 family protein [Lutibacter sp.]|nr:MAG: TIGR01777 family protein [Lutibacter sp.]